MKGIYLGAYKALHPNYDIVYQDINNKRDIGGDMMDIDLSKYDFIIATPPCNFWSQARGNRCSQYSLDTKHLLPDIINKCIQLYKPFIVENVRNLKRLTEHNIIPRTDCEVIIIGRHIYFTNIKFKSDDIIQRQDFRYGGRVIQYEDMKNKDHQWGFNVHNVIERFLETIERRNHLPTPETKAKINKLLEPLKGDIHNE